MMTDNFISKDGLELDTPREGDIVTVLIKPPSQKAPARIGSPMIGIMGGREPPPDHENINHYRVNRIWRVVAVNGSHAVVEPVYGCHLKERKREIWVVAQHRWFDASKLFEMLSGDGDA